MTYVPWDAFKLNYDTRKGDKYYYGYSKENSKPINVYTPVYVNANVTSELSVMSAGNIMPASNIEITLKQNNIESSYYNFNTADPTKNFHFIRFEFDVYNVEYIAPSTADASYGTVQKPYGTIKAGTWIGPVMYDPSKPTFKASVTPTESMDSTYYVLAIQNTIDNNGKIRDDLTNLLLQYKTIQDIKSGLSAKLSNICSDEPQFRDDVLNIGTYYVHKGTIPFAMQIHEFKITDVTDPSWKNTFRKEDGYTHSGVAYYSGIMKWNYGLKTDKNNLTGDTDETFVKRESSELGDFETNILPIGPYKNSNLTYTYAPKLGYSFSFDVKVAGVYIGSNTVEIKPRFYFISKNGNNLYTNIYLFYKNGEGKYVRVGSEADNYKLNFVPNDAYRLKEQFTKSYLSSTSQELGSLTLLKLNAKTMSTLYHVTTQGYTGAVTTYYGEYKLPNTTIAVAVDSKGKFNIDKPLTNGYIGVIFDMSSSSTDSNNTNITTYEDMWKNEGYMKVTADSGLSKMVMKLEKGSLKLDQNNNYNKILGTVILYDADARAADDYN